MIDPTALPRAKSGLPLKAAKTETAASGVVVPRLTMVAPIITFGTPQRVDRLTASSTRISAPVPKI